MSEHELVGNVLSLDDWDETFWIGTGAGTSRNPPFHVYGPHHTLLEYYDRIFTESSPKRAFIPLCGKSLDLLYLADQGHEVVGVEYSEIGVKSFFEENQLKYSRVVSDSFTIWKSEEAARNITIYQGDFYNVNPKEFGHFDVVWDRGSFVAINMEDRERYTNIMFQLMKPSTQYLLQVSEYDGSLYGGPPHFVTEQAMKNTFGCACNYEKLMSKEVDSPPIASGIDWIVSVYLLRLKEPCNL